MIGIWLTKTIKYNHMTGYICIYGCISDIFDINHNFSNKIILMVDSHYKCQLLALCNCRHEFYRGIGMDT